VGRGEGVAEDEMRTPLFFILDQHLLRAEIKKRVEALSLGPHPSPLPTGEGVKTERSK